VQAAVFRENDSVSGLSVEPAVVPGGEVPGHRDVRLRHVVYAKFVDRARVVVDQPHPPGVPQVPVDVDFVVHHNLVFYFPSFLFFSFRTRRSSRLLLIAMMIPMATTTTNTILRKVPDVPEGKILGADHVTLSS
jgi:hypothetical protein